MQYKDKMTNYSTGSQATRASGSWGTGGSAPIGG